MAPHPPPAPPARPSLDAAERRMVLETKHRHSVAVRWQMAGVGLAIGAFDAAFDWLRAPWQWLLLPMLGMLVANAVAAVVRRRHFAPWHLWLMAALDMLLLSALAGFGGPTGIVTLPFFVTIIAGQALGTPHVARLQLALSVPCYAAARYLGSRALHFDTHLGRLAIEVLCLAALGWFGTAGPLAITARLRRARLALGALERGDFDARLPESTRDDLGFLAVSFNRTAEVLGSSVRALRAEVAERERAEAALRESEGHLRLAREDAQATAARMRIARRSGGRVIGADSFAVLHDVLGGACGQVLELDAFAAVVAGPRGREAAAAGAAEAALAASPAVDRARAERRSVLADEPPGPARRAAARRSPRRCSAPTRCSACSPRAPTAPGAYGPADVEVLEALAALAATAVRNVLLVDELRDSRAAYAHQALHDPLTGLPNRARLHERLAHALGGAHPERVSVLVLDLDGFKRVNDSLGHPAGDTLLVQVAQRLLAATRGSDTVARLGGDEFAVLLDNARQPHDAVGVAERVLDALRTPFLLAGPDGGGSAEAVVGTSVGIARGAPHGARAAGDAASAVDALLRDADLAMYRAKASGKGRYTFFEPSMHAEAVSRLELEADLRAALARGEFRLVYQPIVALADGRIEGVEALARWDHPLRGTVSPADFIPLAEETGIIVPLGRWVLGEACRQARAWADAGLGDAPGAALTVTVNVSGRQVYDPAFVDDVRAALAAAGVDPRRLVLELTESVMIDRPELALERFTALKAVGVRLAIDDFGTGYSALSYLQRFPIDVLKIDRSFVDGLRKGGPQGSLARTIVALGQALSLRTVAEGIEDAAQRAALHEVGCPLGQGFLFARPLEPAAVAALLDAGATVDAPARVPALAA
jgi:diguanylate cyclase (GGDEF)-like protein